MQELLDVHPPVEVPESEYQRLLGFPPDYKMEGRVRELADRTADWHARHGKPWIYARTVDDIRLHPNSLQIQGRSFSSQSLLERIKQTRAHAVVFALVSAGKPCEEKARTYWSEGKPDEYFFMETFGSAVVEHLIAKLSLRICEWADRHRMAALPHDSPGYTGWDIAEQAGLWEAVATRAALPFPEEIRLTEAGMLKPKKSQLAVFPITRQVEKARSLSSLVPCHRCALPACDYRRAPYRRPLPQVESARRLQSSAPADRRLSPSGAFVLDPDARYSVHPKALSKWSRRNLRLKILPDGSVHARFRFEGTTCMNLGCPLAFDYCLELDTPENRYRIQHAQCEPAPGDAGHGKMCAYLNDRDALLQSIAGEKPLLGRPLNDVLTWRRNFNPSGCLCERESRVHKWGLALEVIHYALAQQANPETVPPFQ